MKELPQHVAVMYFIVLAWRSGITPQMAVVQNALFVINCSLQFNPSKRVFYVIIFLKTVAYQLTNSIQKTMYN